MEIPKKPPHDRGSGRLTLEETSVRTGVLSSTPTLQPRQHGQEAPLRPALIGGLCPAERRGRTQVSRDNAEIHSGAAVWVSREQPPSAGCWPVPGTARQTRFSGCEPDHHVIAILPLRGERPSGSIWTLRGPRPPTALWDPQPSSAPALGCSLPAGRRPGPDRSAAMADRTASQRHCCPDGPVAPEPESRSLRGPTWWRACRAPAGHPDWTERGRPEGVRDLGPASAFPTAVRARDTTRQERL